MKKILLIGFVIVMFVTYISYISNPYNCNKIKDIPAPIGFTKIECEDYLLNLPLKSTGTNLKHFTGDVLYRPYNYAVVDIPVLSNYEQCADMCFRLRAESRKEKGLPISFKDVNGNTHTCKGDLHNYLKNLYGIASTYSLFKETKSVPFSQVQVGDILCYPSREKGRYGHAITVVNVATLGNIKCVMLAEGSTPAVSLHILRNTRNPYLGPWFILPKDNDTLHINRFYYKPNELRRYS